MERTKIVTGTLEDRRAIDWIFKEMTSGDLYADRPIFITVKED